MVYMKAGMLVEMKVAQSVVSSAQLKVDPRALRMADQRAFQSGMK